MEQNVRIDGIVWYRYSTANNVRHVQPLCPIHSLRLKPTPNSSSTMWGENAFKLKCEDCENPYSIPRTYSNERQYVLDRIDAKVFRGMKILNLDDEATPIAKAKVSSNDDKYFITAQLMESKRGLQVVVYAGEKGSGKKTQIFVDPEVKRLSFDHKDLNPSDIFTSITATFSDNSSHTIKTSS